MGSWLRLGFWSVRAAVGIRPVAGVVADAVAARHVAAAVRSGAVVAVRAVADAVAAEDTLPGWTIIRLHEAAANE